MELDPLLLSRIQFAFVVSFHILFPAFTIGLAAFIAVLEGLYLKTANPAYLRLSKFWLKVFAVSFGMGVVSGIVMAFQFGTNWSAFSFATANFMGPVLAYEALTAFFLEATFLGVLLFGRDKVPQGMHFFSAVMVAFGTTLSTFWIISANSWMQTPDGVEMREGMIYVTSWMDAVFNPSFLARLPHMVLAAFLTTAFFVIGVSAWYLLKRRHVDTARIMFSMTMWLVLVLAPLQIFMGDMHGLNTFEHQPAKVAAMEGAWETKDGAPLILFAIPDQEEATNHYEIAIPNLASFILTHSWNGTVPGLEEWAPEDRPYVRAVFWLFRVMVGIGVLMMLIGFWGAWKRWRGELYDSPVFLRICTFTLPLGFLATLSGWLVTEMGRYPWVVYETIRIEDAVTPSVTGGVALASLLVYIAAYAVIFSAGSYFIWQILRKGPESSEPEPDIDDPLRRPGRPFSAAE